MISRRSLLQAGGALVVALSAPAAAQVLADGDKALGKPLALTELDSFLAIHADGTATLYSGKVDLGTGLRIAYRQIAAEELGLASDRIRLIEGDTALTPNQGPTAGSTGIARGGIEIRQAAATARAALIGMAAEKLARPASELEAVDGEVRPIGGGTGIGFGALVGDRRFGLKVDPKAPIRPVADYRLVGRSLARPDVPAKVTGRHPYVHDFVLPGMLHARVVHPPAIGASLLAVDEATAGGARIVRIKDFLALVAEDEWTVVKALGTLKATWSDSRTLTGHETVPEAMRAGPFEGDEVVVRKGDPGPVLAAAKVLTGTFYWPMQTHGSMGPSCAVADVTSERATIWSASQSTHRFRETCARVLGLPVQAVRVIYLDGAGCYGMNGHDDAAADAALISRAVGRPVRVQWTRQDEHGWDPKGPPQLLSLTAALDDRGNIGAWRTEMWLPKATANLPNIPLIGPQAAGIVQTPGLSTGLISQNASPPYACPHVEVEVHWLKDAPLRPSNIRAPGKIANSFAVESFVDELAAAAGRDAVEFRLAGLSDPRGIDVVKRAARLMDWQSRPSPGPGGVGRGMAYVHYKFNETYVAIGMEVAVDRVSGAVKVQRIACAHDCGLMINPDAVRAQVEGNILQTLSRSLFEEVTFDRSRVTSLDWSSYPILTFPDVPKLLIDLVDRPNDPPLGAGEAAAAPVGAALANAIFDAVGVRLRSVPLTAERLKAAMG